MTELRNDTRPQAPLWENNRPDRPEEASACSRTESEALPLPAAHFRITDAQQWIDLCG